MIAKEPSVWLPANEKARLLELIAQNPEAKVVFEGIQKDADSALDAEPNPIKDIESQGRLLMDPLKVKSLNALKDMSKMSALSAAYLVTGKRKYGEKAKQFLSAWARVNVSDGDPIDETKLEPAILAYDWVRDAFSEAERKPVEAWLETIARTHMGMKQATNNWQNHRVKIIGMIGYALRNQEIIAFARRAFDRQLAIDLNPDGSTLDFQERDALHYHIYALRPLLSFAEVAQRHGLSLYDQTSPAGASLRQSIGFLLPYCTGEKKHAEFVHSRVAFDKKRGESGQPEYMAGHPFDPKTAEQVLEQASFFDSKAEKVLAKLTGNPEGSLTSWRLLLNAAGRPDQPLRP